MSTKRLIYTASLRGYRPVIWLGDAVFRRAGQLKDILANRLGESYSQLLAEPLVSEQLAGEDAAEVRWFSDSMSRGIPLTQLSNSQQADILRQLDTQLAQVRLLANQLQQESNSNNRQLGELLLKAIEIPNPSCILTEGDKIVLVMWGFDSEETRQTNFQLQKFIAAQLDEVSPPASTPPKNITSPPAQPPQKAVGQQILPPVPPPPVPPSSRWRFLWKGLLFLFLLLLLLLFFWKRCTSASTAVIPDVLPPIARKLTPIDSTKIKPAPGDSLHSSIIINRLNILLKKGISLNLFATTFKQEYPATEVQFVFYDSTFNLLQLQFPEQERVLWQQRLRKSQDVAVVFDEQVFRAEKQPDDPAFKQPDQSWYFDAIHAYQAWDITEGDSSIIIAVVDNGFDLNHPELSGSSAGHPINIPENSDIVQPVYNPGTTKISPHGTHVAATAIGKTNNGRGAGGIAPKCRLLPVQIASQDGLLSGMAGLLGIQYAILNGARIINMSFGQTIPPEVQRRIASMDYAGQKAYLQQITASSHYQELLEVYNQVFSEANKNGIVLVKACGNESVLTEFDPMGATPYTLNVAAIDPDQKRATFSNFTLNSVSAPGVHIYNAIPGARFDVLDGTSMAAPIVAGAVGLLLTKNPALTPNQVLTILQNTGKPINGPLPIGPLIQLDKALNATSVPTNTARPAPTDPCQHKIDSLEAIIRQLKGAINH